MDGHFAVLQPKIDLFADGMRQPRDFAFAGHGICFFWLNLA
jgi:hypothetical protein